MHGREDHEEVELGLLAAAIPGLALEQSEARRKVAMEALAVAEAIAPELGSHGIMESQRVAE